MNFSYHVLGIGNACMDLLIPVSEEFLSRISGKKGGSQLIDLNQFQQLISDCQAPIHLVIGGSCANAIKGLALLEEKCAFITCVGDDLLGEYFIKRLRYSGILPIFFKSIFPTNQVLCFITPDGQRTMRFFLQDDERWGEFFLKIDYFKKIKLLHLTAYSLRDSHLIKRAMKLAKQVKASVSIDLSSFEIVQEYREKIKELLCDYVDIVFANKDETKALTTLSPLEGCLKLQEMCSIAVVLMGKEGCLVGHQGKVFHSPSFPPMHIIDSTGAGDLFASGFLFGYLNDYPLAKCAELGNRLGSAIVDVEGAEFPPEKWEKIKKTLF